MSLEDIKSKSLEELQERFRQEGQPAYKALQVYQWLHRGVSSFDEMTNISKALRQYLAERYYISVANIEKKLVSDYDNTIKYLFRFRDGEYVESVLMQYHHGYSICISTQVGCKMGCTFCATGKSGYSRNLTPSEMLAQVQAAQLDNHIRISNIVLMGMGEPLDNYDNVIRFLHLVNAPEGLNISLRNISLSTCGLVPNMLRLAEENLPVTLSVSLHAPNDEIRRTMMPVANVYPMDDLLQACRNYVAKTGRRVIFEYALVAGVNCEDRHADELARKLRGLQCHVNLIPLNSVKERNLMSPGRALAERFQARLTHDHISATIRREMGADIDGACGQLRRRVLQEKKDT